MGPEGELIPELMSNGPITVLAIREKNRHREHVIFVFRSLHRIWFSGGGQQSVSKLPTKNKQPAAVRLPPIVSHVTGSQSRIGPEG
ncbi:MAG: hypothetical protein H6618_00915 [Deltaproteobacteria bacterium]|nr:hypothetical protein [Deltaproteobacteria bacterium]